MASDKFKNLENDELIFDIAFEQKYYCAEEIVTLKQCLALRGITPDEIVEERRKLLLRDSIRTKCVNCGERLELDYDELLKGEFSCPDCAQFQPVHFPKRSYVNGIGGWLILLGCGLLLGLVVEIFSTYNSLIEGEILVGSLALVDIGITVLLLYTMERMKSIFPRFMIIYLGMAALLGLLLGVMVWPLGSSEFYGEVVPPIIAATIWIPYFILSKRVKATFIYPIRQEITMTNRESIGEYDGVDKNH